MLFIVLALSRTQWTTLVTGRFMITMMVLLCYVNLSGMSLECMVIVLMNSSLLGGQDCTDSVDVQQSGDNVLSHNRLAIIPRLNFTCNGRITSIGAGLWPDNRGIRNDSPYFQVWRAESINLTIYNKIREIQLKLDDQVNGSGNFQTANITLTGSDRIEVKSGDVVGYYHPPDTRYRVKTIRTDGYILYQFIGSHQSVNLNNSDDSDNYRQPLIQFTIGKCFCSFCYYFMSKLNINFKISFLLFS